MIEIIDPYYIVFFKGQIAFFGGDKGQNWERKNPQSQ